VGRPHPGVVPPPRRRNPARLHPELDPVQEEKLPGRQALRHVEPRRQDLQRVRERHFFGHLLLPETHGHGVGEGPEDVDPRLSVAGRRNPRTLRRHQSNVGNRDHLLVEFQLGGQNCKAL